MQGVSLTTDASGQPVVLTIDLRNVPADASLLLEALLARVQHDAERGEWLENPQQPDRNPRKAGSLAGRGSLPANFNEPLEESTEQPPQNGIRFGSLKGMISTPSDFNEPLDDLSEYM